MVGLAPIPATVACALTLLAMASFLPVEATSHSHGERQERAIGGQEFDRGRWPWLALLKATVVTERLFGFLPTRHYHLYCGGVLISRRWILTAAHCFTEDGRAAGNPHNWEARLGSVRLRATPTQHLMNLLGHILDNDDMRHWEIDLDTVVMHPGYNASNLYSDDIALVKLSRPAPYNSRVRPIRLPSRDDASFPAEGQACITKGWGCTTRGGDPSYRAREIHMPIYSTRLCSYHFNLPDSRKRLCAGYRDRGIGVCEGDSGSPLVCPTRGSYKLAGIVSFASRSRPESFPAVFTRVHPYLSWIYRVISEF